ncbi:MAG: hypothetical protein NTW04_00395, partial [Elusimicrobia bacterium]|nr:hypothetical protein [Elusimicrobiota bacterium]
ADWLNKNGLPPLEYAVGKCKQHQLVIFGERHHTKEYLDFFNQLIPLAYHNAGVRYVVLEVSKYADNEKISKLIEGDSFDRNLALEIARNGPWPDWNNKEYWNVFETVWKLNKSLPEGQERMKVIGMDIDVDLALDSLLREGKLTDKKLIEKTKAAIPLIMARDELMTAAIEESVLKNDSKGIVLVGYNHSYTHYAQPSLSKDRKYNGRDWPRMANILYRKYGERIFQIALHIKHLSPKEVFPAYEGAEPAIIDFIESIMALGGNKPVGFDVFTSPFANLKDKGSYYFYFQPWVKFSDISRGYIFLKPLKELTPCAAMDNFVTDKMFKKYRAFYEKAYNRKFANVAEVNAAMKAEYK